ncbi:MAG: nuclear transport factor 2 family protein [Rhizobiaceae bacterium]
MAKKDQIKALLKSIETGDPGPVAVVNEAKYIQHNPQTHEGSEGLVALFQRLSRTSPRVNIVRAFEDGEFVFAHTEYDFSTRRIGFEVFRFEEGQAVEHWDNIQPRLGPNKSGHSMVDGETDSSDPDRTEANRALVGQFVETVLIDGDLDRLGSFIDEARYVEHNPRMSDDIDVLRAALEEQGKHGRLIDYQKIHRILAEGSFVLCVSEGRFDGTRSALYDMFRIADGKIVEHWDTLEKIAPRSEWKNTNGKF